MKLKINDGTIIECESYEVIEDEKLPESLEDFVAIKKAENNESIGFWPETQIFWPTRDLSEASEAMYKLAWLRQEYWDGWKPDWADSYQRKYVIYFSLCDIESTYEIFSARFLVFETEEKRDLFLENHRDLIEQAKPLL